MDAIAQTHHATVVVQGLLLRVGQMLAARGAHPARTVVLLPYAQLMPLAKLLWARQAPQGFAPRFETTMNWAGQAAFAPQAQDICFDMGRDLLTARALLEQAGLGARADMLAGRVVELACQIAPLAAAVAPDQRPAWAGRMRPVVALGMDAPVLALESAVARVALEWVVASAYPGDWLLAPEARAGLDMLVVFEGFQQEPLARALAALYGDKAVAMALHEPGPMGQVHLHEADDPSDEAERAAACVLRHVEAGRVPVALGAIDRVLTRRVRAMLEGRGVSIRDETGWKLSTTRAAAGLMAALRACTWDAGTDAVIDWLKNASGAPTSAVLALERRVRRHAVREWRALQPGDLGEGTALPALVAQVNEWRESLKKARPLVQWLAALRGLLEATGQWPMLEGDAAGLKVLAALRLADGAQAEFEPLPQAARRLDLAGFTAWVNDALEAGSFVPPHRGGEQVVILPFHQLLGRPFAALVLAGCDEQRLAPAPEPPGPWTAAQREALGLPSRAELESQLRQGWRHALQTPQCDLLWRRADDSGEPLLPSPLVLQLQLQQAADASQAGPHPLPGQEPRQARLLVSQPVPRPLPVGDALPVAELSASAYEDLRRCPYRFFALRQLGLQEADELDTEVDKRDFGNWLHAVLSAFHQTLRDSWEPPGPARLALLDTCADQVTREMRLEEGEFLPFAAAWPQVRDGYLDWQAGQEAQGAQFVQAESRYEMPLGPVKLIGRIDRMDRDADGTVQVIDYKTEALATTRERVKVPEEDTQLAFYAALLEHDTLRAAYVNVGEQGGTRSVEQPDVVSVRDALVEGILHDMRRIADGAPLPALGEGKVCDFCSARGLCRKDSWS